MLGKKIKSIENNNYYLLFFTIVFILILIQFSFSTIDATFYDLWTRLDFGMSKNNDIVVITLDEESDEFLGEIYPYTYATHSRLLSKIVKDRPTSVAYFLEFLEPDSQADLEFFKEFKNIILNYKKNGGDLLFATEINLWGEQLPPKELRDIGYSLALINRDSQVFAKDDVSRRAILNVSGEDTLHLRLANRLRLQRGLEFKDSSAYFGSYYDQEADATFAFYRYFANPNDSNASILSIPFHRVFSIPSDFFKDKIVLIGPKYISNSDDFVLTPFRREGVKSSKMNLHAVIIEALAQDKTLFPLADAIIDLISILVAIFLSYIISKLQPTRGLLITICTMLGMFILSYLFFTVFGLWIKMSHILLSVFVVYYIWVPFRAIGEYKTRFAIQEESKMLKQVDNLKRNFISLMSHDLKTPVAKIAGIADILSVQYQNTPEQSKLITNIIQSTRELNQFITSILDLTKVESRNLSLKMVTKDVNQIIENVVEKLKFEAQLNEVKVETNLAPLYPITLDVELMIRVLSNLIENAIKYSGSSSKVEISTWDDDTWVYIEIKDNGVGIAREDLEHIFDKFYRVKNDSSHKIKGSGLGLYLVKYFVELHQGQIEAKSKLGEGTRFTVKLKNG